MNVDFKPPSVSVKGFWQRPEGTTGMISIALGVVAGLVGLQQALPLILGVLTLGVAVVGKAIVLAVSCAILAMILLIITNKKVHALVGYIFKSVMRAITSVVVEIDPIGIMKNYIDDLKGKLGEMDATIAKLNGQITVCKNRVNKMNSDYDKAMKTAMIAREKELTSQFTVNARQAGRLNKSSMTLSQLLTTMEMHLRALRKFREVSETVILDMTNEVEVKQEERKMILASYSAIQSAMSILNGDPDKKALFDQAMEFVVSDYGMKLGEIEDFMINSKSFVEGLDLQNGVYEEEALTRLKEWENKADSILLGDDKRLLIEHSSVSANFQIQPEAVGVTQSYDDLFFKK
jgi:DNA-binding transcriptional regulator YbjK